MKNIENQINTLLITAKKIGITTKMISIETGISEHSLSNWRQGKSSPNQSNLLKLRNFTLKILVVHGLDFPLKKEFRETFEKFYEFSENILKDMKKTYVEEENILLEHNENAKVQHFLEKALDFQIFDAYINTDFDKFIKIEKKNKISRNIEKKHQKTFIQNLNLLMDFIDENTEKDIEELVSEKWEKGKAEDFFLHLPHDEDFDESVKISSVAELWISKELGVSKTQIINWKKGNDFPSEENLIKLKQLLNLKGKGTFLMYEFDRNQFEAMFLPRIENDINIREERFCYSRTLEFFTNVLFLYCGEELSISQLKKDMKNNIIKESQENIVSSFFKEMRNMEIVKEVRLDAEVNISNQELTPYINMDDIQINYILNKKEEILNRIFTKPHVGLLKKVSESFFIDELKEGVNDLIFHLKSHKGVDNIVMLDVEPKFRLLYSPANYSIEEIEDITDSFVSCLHHPIIKKWVASEYSFDELSDQEIEIAMDFARMTMLNNNQDLRIKVRDCTLKKWKYEEPENQNKYFDLIIYFEDLSNPYIIEKIFGRK